jgi:hypothetical protein
MSRQLGDSRLYGPRTSDVRTDEGAAAPDLSRACHSSFHFDSASFLISVWSAFFVGFILGVLRVLVVTGMHWPSGLGSGGFHAATSSTSLASTGNWMKGLSVCGRYLSALTILVLPR